MTVTTVEARGRILDDLATAADQLALAAASLAAAYERLDDATADRLEDQLYRPVQKAFGRAKRTRSQFAERTGLRMRALEAPAEPSGSRTPKELVDRGVLAAGEATHVLAELQDSMVPIDAGDPELRAGLAQVREIVGPLTGRAREITRVLGR